MVLIYFWAFCSVPLIYMFVFVQVPYSFDYCSFFIYSEVRENNSSSSVLLHQHCFDYSGSFAFLCKFKKYLFQFCEKYHWYFDKDCIESVDCLGQFFCFNNTDFFFQSKNVVYLPACVILLFFLISGLQFLEYCSFAALGRFVFILFDVMVSEIFSSFFFLLFHCQYIEMQQVSVY